MRTLAFVRRELRMAFIVSIVCAWAGAPVRAVAYEPVVLEGATAMLDADAQHASAFDNPPRKDLSDFRIVDSSLRASVGGAIGSVRQRSKALDPEEDGQLEIIHSDGEVYSLGSGGNGDTSEGRGQTSLHLDFTVREVVVFDVQGRFDLLATTSEIRDAAGSLITLMLTRDGSLVYQKEQVLRSEGEDDRDTAAEVISDRFLLFGDPLNPGDYHLSLYAIAFSDTQGVRGEARGTWDLDIVLAPYLDCPVAVVDENTIYGTANDDVLTGTPGSDVILGLGGDDEIHGRGGDDIICGGPGKDRLYGEEDDDELYGESGNDQLYGGSGEDTLGGGKGDDNVSGEDDADILVGGFGDDELDGGDGTDSLFGNEGSDLMAGGPEIDLLDGGPDDDVMEGGSGDDTLKGGPGDDTLYGGDDDDTLDGGDDSDHLYGDDGNDQIYANAERDETSSNHLFGGDDEDSLFGSSGSDYLYGEADRDSLYGMGGNDELYAGDGIGDEMRGGSGADRLRGSGTQQRYYGEAGGDQIFACNYKLLPDLVDGGPDTDFAHVDPRVWLGGSGLGVGEAPINVEYVTATHPCPP